MTIYNEKRNTILTTFVCALTMLFGFSLWGNLPEAMVVGSVILPKFAVLTVIPLLMAVLNYVINKTNGAPSENCTEKQLLAHGAVTWLVPYVTVVSMALILFVNFVETLPVANLAMFAGVFAFLLVASAYSDTKGEDGNPKGNTKVTTIIKFVFAILGFVVLYLMYFVA